MADEKTSTTGIAAHGASRLPSVDIDSFNIGLKDDEGFLGDRASKGAFKQTLEKWRKLLRKSGDDPFGTELSENISKKDLDAILVGDDTEAWVVVHSAIEDFAQDLALVTQRFLKTKAWENTERIVVGGGFRESRLGELAIARAEVILKAEDFKIGMLPIHNHPDDAGLIGALHLAPSLDLRSARHNPRRRHRRHEHPLRSSGDAAEEGAGPVQGVRVEVGNMASRRRRAQPRGGCKTPREDVKDLIAKADKEGLKLAPFIGIACPGVIESDGSIEKGAQNLPGNWESSKFNLPASLVEAIPQIGEHDTAIVMHNDGVVQGLSEFPFVQDVKRWGVLTIGTGLGNARFSNRDARPIAEIV